MIVVRDVGDAAEDVADELKGVLAAPLDDLVLVLVHPGGTKGKSLLDAARKAGAVVVECKAVKWESDKVPFVQGEFKAAGRRVAPDAAVALVDAVGSDLRELASGCAQLVADTVGHRRPGAGRALPRRPGRGDRLQGGRRRGRGPLRGGACGCCGTPWRPASTRSRSTRPSRPGCAPWPRWPARRGRPGPTTWRGTSGWRRSRSRKARGQLGGWTPDGVSEAIVAVAHADEQIKGGGTDPVYALERAVVAIVDGPVARLTGLGTGCRDTTKGATLDG